jgi:hypothetical protein
VAIRSFASGLNQAITEGLRGAALLRRTLLLFLFNGVHQKMKSIAVVYLDRATNPKWAKLNFISSIKRNRAGRPFDLIIIEKGYSNFANSKQRIPQNIPDMHVVETVGVSDELFPLRCLFDFALSSYHEYLLFFTSWSKALAPLWLDKMMSCAERNPECGVVASTASWEALDQETPFPNPSVRTNGFLIKRSLLIELQTGRLETKFDGNLFEAGPNSLYNQIVGLGLEGVVVDRDGREWRVMDWPKSQTFRSGNQDGLLFADNRTQDFAQANRARRKKLLRLAWGEAGDFLSPSIASRVNSYFRYRYNFH